jgi:hypothetical protein
MSIFSSPASTIPSTIASELSHATQRSIPTLLGKSNFELWHASIDPILLSNEQARSLISGAWFEPRSLPSSSSHPTSPTSPVSAVLSPSHSHTILYNVLHAPPLSRASISTHQAAHRTYEHANLTITRFIRGTLAINVLPFVRQHTSAKGLYEQLVYLYGERAGIDMFGGPTMSIALQGRRMTEPTISRISEEGDTSPMLPATNRRLTNESFLGYDPNTPFSNVIPTNNPPHHSTIPKQKQQQQKKKKAGFKFPGNLAFRRSSKDKHDTAIILSPKTTTAFSPTSISPPASSLHNHTRESCLFQSAPATPYYPLFTPASTPTPTSPPAALNTSTTSISDTSTTSTASDPPSNTTNTDAKTNSNPNLNLDFSFDFSTSPSTHLTTTTTPQGPTTPTPTYTSN